MNQNLLFSLYQMALIALGGAVGTVARYTIGGWTHRWLGTAFPYGTLTVNLIGCFLLGLIAHIGQTTDLIPPHYRQAATIGMLGGFTTFSSFGYETWMQLQGGQWRQGLLNIGANVVVGLLAVWLGVLSGRQWVGGA